MTRRLYRIDHYGRRTPASWWRQLLFRLSLIGARRA